MKFVCDKCNTRYSIADERVHGRVLKIRCKACNHVITVREEQPLPPAPPAGESLEDALNNFQRDEEATRVSSMPPLNEAAGLGDDAWFVSFDGEQEGPLPLQRALDRVRLERPRGKECYCWRGGFFVWLPVEEVPEFAPALVKLPPPIPAVRARPATGAHAAVKSPTGSQPALKSATGSHAAVKSPTGSQPALKSTTGGTPAVKSPTGNQPAVKSPAGNQPALKSTTGGMPAVKSPTGNQPAVKSPTGSQPALRSPTGSQPALRSTTGSQPALKSTTGQPPALKAPSGSMNAVKPASDLPSMDSGPLGTPGALLPSLETRPEPRLLRREESSPLPPTAQPTSAPASAPLGDMPAPLGATPSGPAPLGPSPFSPTMLPDSGPSTLSPFAKALQASGPTQVAADAPKHNAPEGKVPTLDSGPVPLPPPPGDDLPIDEPSGMVNLSHVSRPALASPLVQSKPVVETFGGVAVTPSKPTPPPQPIVVATGRAGAAGWLKWAALGGAAATVALLVVVVVLMQRKPTVIVVPPAPAVDDGKKVADKPITVDDPAVPTPAPAPSTMADAKRAQKRPPSSARSSAAPKPPADKLSNAQRSLASLYRDDSTEHAAAHALPSTSESRAGAGGQVSQQAIMAVVTQNRRSLNLCYDRVLKHDSSLKSGRVVTHVKIGISGSVTGVNVPDPQYANSEIGQCIAQTIKHWHFPSADAEYETEFPIILQAN